MKSFALQFFDIIGSTFVMFLCIFFITLLISLPICVPIALLWGVKDVGILEFFSISFLVIFMEFLLFRYIDKVNSKR